MKEHIGALVLGLRRNRTQLSLSESTELLRGDVIRVYCSELCVETLVNSVGHVERDVIETDLFTFALGIAAGLGLGTLAVTVGGVTIQLGMAGGLLISGLVVGFLRSIWAHIRAGSRCQSLGIDGAWPAHVHGRSGD